MNNKIIYTLCGICALLIIIGLININKEEDIPNTQPAIVGNIKTPEVLNTDVQKIPNTQYLFYPVSSVVDGDTVKININGKIETFRLIGLDTPETVDPRKEVQCFGVEASNKAKELLSGKKVRIETDPSQGTYDKYNRSLGYIYLENGLFYNKYMILQGYAHEYTYLTPYKYQTEFKLAQKEAQTNKLGFWATSTCNGNTTSSSTITVPEISPVTSTSDSCTIKGNINSNNEKIYHTFGCSTYTKTVIDESKGEKWFCSEIDATNAGWRKALNCN